MKLFTQRYGDGPALIMMHGLFGMSDNLAAVGIFDGMRSYALNNGWDRFLEHNPPFHDDFPKATFSTIWGVCDEQVFDQAIVEFRKLYDSGKPFFGTVLT